MKIWNLKLIMMQTSAMNSRYQVPWFYIRYGLFVACVFVTIGLLQVAIKSDGITHLAYPQNSYSSPYFYVQNTSRINDCCPCKDNERNTRSEEITTTLPPNNSTSTPPPPVYKVPNIVHYTWYATEDTPMTFKQYIGVLSAYKILKPDKIYIHMNISNVPGPYFQKLKALDKVEAVNDGCPKSLFSQTLVTNETIFFSDYSDIGRIKYLLKYGGIYLDYDVFVIQPFDKFRRDYEFTLGQEQSRDQSYDLLNAGIIISAKDAPFLYLWACSYVDDYRPQQWIYNSGVKPTTLWKRFPHLINVERDKLNRPNWRPGEIDKIWGNITFNWKENFALHTWYRYRSRVDYYKNLYGELAPDEKDIQTMNNTYAEISRYILSL